MLNIAVRTSERNDFRRWVCNAKRTKFLPSNRAKSKKVKFRGKQAIARFQYSKTRGTGFGLAATPTRTTKKTGQVLPCPVDYFLLLVES
jgi:hypothetical protein